MSECGVIRTKQILHPCFQELLALALGQSLELRCRQAELPALAHAWAEGPGSATQNIKKKNDQNVPQLKMFKVLDFHLHSI